MKEKHREGDRQTDREKNDHFSAQSDYWWKLNVAFSDSDFRKAVQELDSLSIQKKNDYANFRGNHTYTVFPFSQPIHWFLSSVDLLDQFCCKSGAQSHNGCHRNHMRHVRRESAREQRKRYIKAMNNNNNNKGCSLTAPALVSRAFDRKGNAW